MKQKNSIGHIICILCVLVWGTTFISTKTLLLDFLPVELLFFRATLAVIAMLIFCPKFLKGTSLRQELLMAAAGFFGITAYSLLEIIALVYTQASNVGVIVSVAPFFTAILSILFLKQEKPKSFFFLGFIVAMIGILMISFSNITELSLNPTGDILAIGAALSWAIYSILIKKISAWDYPTILTTRRIFFYGILFMIPFMLRMGFTWNLSRFANPINLFNIIFLGVGASALCFAGWNYAIKILGPLKTSVYIYLVPVIAVATSVAFLDERLTFIGIVGTIFTLLGLLVSEYKSKKK